MLDAVAALPRPEVSGLRWTSRDQWHVTLRFLGEADVDDAIEALDVVRSGGTTAVLGPATGRFGRRVLHVPVAGLDAVAAAVIEATAGIGSPPDDRPFHGHLTLARGRDRRGVDLRPLCGAAVVGEWTAGEVCLVASQLHPKGARYETVHRVPLGPPG